MVDFCNTEDAPILEMDVDLVIQEIEMILDTNHGELLGDYYFGSDYDQFLYDLKVSSSYIEQYTRNRLESICSALGFNLDVIVSIHGGELSDIILVKVNLIKDGIMWQKIYNISI